MTLFTLYWYLQAPDGATISTNSRGTIMSPGDVGNLSEVCYWRDKVAATLTSEGFEISFRDRKRTMIATRGKEVKRYLVKRTQEHSSLL